MSRVAFNGCRLTLFRDFGLGLWGATMVALTGCGSSSSGSATQNPGQEAGTAQFSDAMAVGDSSGVAPGPEAGAPTDGGFVDAITVVDGGGIADSGVSDSTVADGSPADSGPADVTLGADTGTTGAEGGVEAGRDGSGAEAAASDSGPEAASDASPADASPDASAVTGPCDIYAIAGTPCVAAHSTVRALFGAYAGNLYQVKRASDGTTMNIGVLSPGGFANSATQDTFCMGTTCTISIIYDQSAKANHLTSAPAGGNKNTPDNEASATSQKLTIGGHSVYAVVVNTGIGYRIDKTSGIATGDEPEGEYMVTSGTHFNGGCCFDYGNAETNNDDDGNGTMEAVYFGNEKAWGTGAGNGPWVMADLENGLYTATNFTSNPMNTPLTSDFVTAMVKGFAGGFAVKGGNAQSGTLTTMYDGARPTSAGYNPMKKQGAIILGIGGDNSNSAVGTFFEGCMTSGNPPDATDEAVQANIVAAGYGD